METIGRDDHDFGREEKDSEKREIDFLSHDLGYHYCKKKNCKKEKVWASSLDEKEGEGDREEDTSTCKAQGVHLYFRLRIRRKNNVMIREDDEEEYKRSVQTTERERKGNNSITTSIALFCPLLLFLLLVLLHCLFCLLCIKSRYWIILLVFSVSASL